MTHKLIIIESCQTTLVYFRQNFINLILEGKMCKRGDICAGQIDTMFSNLKSNFIKLNRQSQKGYINSEASKKNINYNSTNCFKYLTLVQIKKESAGLKAPNITKNINLLGKKITILPISKSCYQTKKSRNKKNTTFLYALSHLLTNNNHNGIIINPNCINTNTDFIIKENETLKLRWTKVHNRLKKLQKPTIIIKNENLLKKIFYKRFFYNKIFTDSKKLGLKIKKILSKNTKIFKIQPIIEVYENPQILITNFNIYKHLSTLLTPKVNLSKGGYIIVQKTETLNTLDVNSGFTKLKAKTQFMNMWINYGSIYQIVQLIKLRNISGLIVINFTESNQQKDQLKILTYLNKVVKTQETDWNIIQMSKLNLIEIARRRYGQSFYDKFTQQCQHCLGLGYIDIFNKQASRNLNLLFDLFPN